MESRPSPTTLPVIFILTASAFSKPYNEIVIIKIIKIYEGCQGKVNSSNCTNFL